MKKVLIIFSGLFVGIIVLVGIIFLIITLTTKKMTCTAPLGEIVIMHNDDEVVGYTANGLDYDLDAQKAYSRQVGITNYLNEFEDFFLEATDGQGVCERN